MKIEPFDENQICNLISPDSLGIDEKYNFAKSVARAAQADALRQVIEGAKQAHAFENGSAYLPAMGIYFVSLESALAELEKDNG